MHSRPAWDYDHHSYSALVHRSHDGFVDSRVFELLFLGCKTGHVCVCVCVCVHVSL
jgi:hypothetical protein